MECIKLIYILVFICINGVLCFESNSAVSKKNISTFNANSGKRRFKPGKSIVTSQLKPANSITKRNSNSEPKIAKPLNNLKQVIYINNIVDKKFDPDLNIEWLNKDYIPQEIIKVPKNLREPINVPDGILYFRIANDTNILTSIPLRVASNTIYKVACSLKNSDDRCFKLEITDSKMHAIQTDAPYKDYVQNQKVPKGSKVIYINNNTNKELLINWISGVNKIISNKKLSYRLGRQAFVVPVNAKKIRLVRAASLKSNVVNFNLNDEFEVDCEPDEYDCNEIVIKKTKKPAKIKNQNNSILNVV